MNTGSREFWFKGVHQAVPDEHKKGSSQSPANKEGISVDHFRRDISKKTVTRSFQSLFWQTDNQGTVGAGEHGLDLM